MAPRTKTKNLPALSVKIAEEQFRKANESIAIRPMTGDALTFLTRKLFNTMLLYAQKAQEKEPSNTVFRMPLRVITRASSFDSNDTALVKAHLRKLRRTEVEWNDKGKEWGIASLLSSATIRKEEGELWLEWEYSSTMQGRLLSPGQYTPIALAHQAMMRTHAGLVLLEICLRYETFSARLTDKHPWDWWYPVLTGNLESDSVTSRQYFYRYFKRDTIKPAIEEVESLTDFKVTLIEHTQGRKVIDIQFQIDKKQQQDLELGDQQMFDVSLVSRMIGLGLKDAEAQKIYAGNEENRIRSALDLTEKKLRSRKPPENAIGYFRWALTWDGTKEGVPAADRPALPPPSKADTEVSPDAGRAMAAYEALPLPDQKRVRERFAESLKEPLLTTYMKSGLGSVMIRRSLERWLVKAGY